MPDLVRAYPLAVPLTLDMQASAGVILAAAQAALAASWQEAAFESLVGPHASTRAYKWADATGWLPVDVALPSRVRRAAQEVAGRTLRSQSRRRELYGLLRQDDGALACRLADRERHSGSGALVARNVAEAMGNWWRQHPDACLPERYTDFQPPPILRAAILTAAADDGPANGQFMRYGLTDAARRVWFRVKAPDAGGTWRWSNTRALALPGIVRRKLAAGWRLAAPDIRVRADGQAWFDLKLACPRPVPAPLPEPDKRRVLGVDWGLRHLVVLQAVEGARRLGQPAFVHEAGLLAKLAAIRDQARFAQQAGAQACRAASLALTAGLRLLAAGLMQVATYRAVQKRALWTKYRHMQQTLAQNAALAIVRRALALGCQVIAVEALGGLRSQDKGSAINWRVNSQIRAFTHRRVEDLAQEHGLRVKLVSAHQTSLSCPACRAVGMRAASPEHVSSTAGGAWFRCPACSYNASADYVAATNVALLGAHARAGQRVATMPAIRRTLAEARRALFFRLRRLLAQQARARTSPVSYTGAGSVLPLSLSTARLRAADLPGYPRRVRHSRQRELAPPLVA